MGQLSSVTLPQQKVAGAPSWLLNKGHVEAALTEEGGQLAPVTFRIGSKRIAPCAVAPWSEEVLPDSVPPALKLLRGQFFCAPFGLNERPHNGEKHPVHGESANGKWQLIDARENARELVGEFSLKTSIRKGEIRKQIRLLGSQTCIYTRHTLSGFSGPLPLGYQTMIRFPEEPMSGFLSTGPFALGQVYPTAFENPVLRGYQSLKPGAKFKSLHQVPMIDGSLADLSHYPARPGFDDLVMMVAGPKQKLGWNAITFPREGYAWFALKDCRQLRSTLIWTSNGGRHYAPWNGRHSHIMGVADATACFNYGLAESANENSLSREGCPTALELSEEKPTTISYITGVVAIPSGFDRVATVKATEDRKSIVLTSTSGHEVQTPVDLDYLAGESK